MKITADGNEGISNNLYPLDGIFGAQKKRTDSAPLTQSRAIDNGYSSLPFKELNNKIGILQRVLAMLQNMATQGEFAHIKAQMQSEDFKSIFTPSMILKDESDETLLDANRLLNALPSDERDLYAFKKVLKSEIAFTEKSLEKLQDSALLAESIAESSVDSAPFDYLTSNAMLFAKAHNTASLRDKLDALLA